MRSLFSLLLLLSIVSTTSAQEIMLGAKLGGGLSSLTDAAPQQHAAFSFLGGLACTGTVSPNIELQIELLYAQRGYTYTESAADNARMRVALRHLDIPVSARFAVVQEPSYAISVIMGGYASFLLGTDVSPSLQLPIRVDNARNFDAGVLGGLALDLPIAANRLSVEARCTYGSRDLGEHYEYPLVPPISPPREILHQLSGSTIAATINAAYYINLSR
jgi:hypothetical protein